MAVVNPKTPILNHIEILELADVNPKTPILNQIEILEMAVVNPKTPILNHIEILEMAVVNPKTPDIQDELAPQTMSIFQVLVYNGSHYIPPCEESVTWVIVPAPLTVSQAQLQKLRTTKLKDGTGRVLASTSRDLQKSNNRTILCIMREDPNDGNYAVTMATYSSILVITLLKSLL